MNYCTCFLESNQINEKLISLLVCNNKKAQQLLKWKPRISVDKGLKITYDWAKNNKVVFNAPFTRFYYKSSANSRTD